MTNTTSSDGLVSWRTLTRRDRPSVFTIEPTWPFVDVLAKGLMADASSDALSLARMTVLLPTRRACRALREAFLRLNNGAPMLLPRLVPLNDLDDEDALLGSFGTSHPSVLAGLRPIAPLRRQMILAALILKRDGATHAQAIALAEHLARLIDQLQTEGISFSALATLVPDRYATHWQETLRFLDIVTAQWPLILQDMGCVDPVEHRNQVFAAQARAWADTTTSGPIIAAGSTGSIPATAALLKTIANLPHGCVVLPGLDLDLIDEGWDAIDESHPQFGIKQLMGQLGVTREIVKHWPGTQNIGARAQARRALVTDVMLPAAVTNGWAGIRLQPEATEGLHRLVAPTAREESGAIAMIMRESLEQPGATCALITPDRELARRVAAEMKRWNVAVDDSGGRPLDQEPVGSFLQLIAQMVDSQFAPRDVLALCKHPLTNAGLAPGAFRELTRDAELALFRGPRPKPGMASLVQLAESIEPANANVVRWARILRALTDEFVALLAHDTVTASVALDAHMRCAEALAATDTEAGPLKLWSGDDGDMSARVMAELGEACTALPPLSPSAYSSFFAQCMRGHLVRSRFGQHPRLAILGPLEARLQRFDTVILAGLNEGTWPAAPAADPWLSRPMRAALGLPSPERRIGLAAHDVAEAMCAPRVILSRAEKVEGAPSVPSRWLMRLDQVLTAADVSTQSSHRWLSFARAVNTPARVQSIAPPAPKPPVSVRPRQLSVTEIETWMRDPYAIYAKRILKLTALDPLEADVGSADYGTLIHRALQLFVQRKKTTLDELIAIGDEIFSGHEIPPTMSAFWRPRFQRISTWFIAIEQERRASIASSIVERRGELALASPEGTFVLTAKADRIDIMRDGSATIIDYKTGQPPKSSEVLAGFAPQLPLEAAMVRAGAFKDIGPRQVSELAFWHLHGRDDGASVTPLKGELAEVADDALAGLQKLVATYDNASTPYPAQPSPAYAPKFSDYEHLARVKEWASEDGGDA